MCLRENFLTLFVFILLFVYFESQYLPLASLELTICISGWLQTYLLPSDTRDCKCGSLNPDF